MQINKILSFFLVAICFCMSKMNYLDAALAYGQLSSFTSQAPPISGNALIQIENVDAIFNMGASSDKRSVIIKEDGFYFVLSGAQIGSIDQTTTGYVDVWLVVNKKVVPHTTNRMTVEQPTSTGVLITQAILSLKAGDSVGTAYAASGPSLGVVFLQPDNEPAITSMIFSIFKM